MPLGGWLVLNLSAFIAQATLLSQYCRDLLFSSLGLAIPAVYNGWLRAEKKELLSPFPVSFGHMSLACATGMYSTTAGKRPTTNIMLVYMMVPQCI